MLALAQMLVIIVGEMDVSMGYSIGLCHILAIGFIVRAHLGWGLACLLVLIIGAIIGTVNAFFITIVKINSFIASLGVGTVIYAISNWYTADQQVMGNLSNGFNNIYSAKILGIPIAAFYLAILLLVLWVVLEFTALGRYLYALGGNRRAAELSGIRPKRYIFGAYIAAGLIVAFAGIVLGSRLQIASVGNGPDYLLPVFAGAMLGSTTIKPGRANPLGTIVAVTVLSIGIAGFQQMGSSTAFIVPLFNGTTLLIGVGLAVYAAQKIRATSSVVKISNDSIEKSLDKSRDS